MRRSCRCFAGWVSAVLLIILLFPLGANARSMPTAPSITLRVRECPNLAWARFDRVAPLVRVELHALGQAHDIVRGGGTEGELRLELTDCLEVSTAEIIAVPKPGAPQRRRIDLSDVHPSNRSRTLGLALADLWHSVSRPTATISSTASLGADGLPTPRPPVPSAPKVSDTVARPSASVAMTPPASPVLSPSVAAPIGPEPPPSTASEAHSSSELSVAGRLDALVDASRLLRGAQLELSMPLSRPWLRAAYGVGVVVDREVNDLGTLDFFVPSVSLGLELTAPIGAVRIAGRFEVMLGVALTEVATSREDVDARDELDLIVGMTGLLHAVWFVVPDFFVRFDAGVGHTIRGVRLEIDNEEAGWFGTSVVSRVGLGFPI